MEKSSGINRNRTISILGCGWLGIPLGTHLLREGFSVNGSVTTPEKTGELILSGINPYVVKIDTERLFTDKPDFFHAGILVILIPPRRIESVEVSYPALFKHLIPVIEKNGIKKVLFTSSTSVYPETNQAVTEVDAWNPAKASGKALLEAEQLLSGNSDFKTTILRFGGLIGADRNPARFLQNRKTEIFAGTPVNLIHQDDCIRIILKIIATGCWGEVFNACSPEHPTKKEFYELAAGVSHLPVPEFTGGEGTFKIVSSDKLIHRLNYHFQYPNPLDYLNELQGIQNQNHSER